MLQKISLRDVSAEQIYDSYMGILRISPTDLDGQSNDSMSLFLTNPVDNSGNLRSVVLSDSDGIKLGISFSSKVRTTSVRNVTTGRQENQNVINIVTDTSNLFATQSFNNRSTLIANKEKQTDKISPIQVYHESPSTLGVFDVLAYPIDSPNDASYFNYGNKYNLINYNSSLNVHTQLMDALYKKPKSWYDTNITTEHRVKVGDRFIYTQNENYEEVPILYTHDYILGQYNGHTARMSDTIKNSYISTAVGPERLATGKSLITKLSFIELDRMVWDIVNEAASGYLRQCDGRYNLLGIGENESICQRLFSTILPPQQTAPILATGVSPGIVMNHVMPFRRFIFHVLRQEVRNSAEENNDYKNLRAGVKQYVTDKKITPFAKLNPGFVNTLTKEFVLCDGKELTYDNYPSVNTDNQALFQHNDKGIVQRNSSTQKPTPTTKEQQSEVYKAIAASNADNAPDGSTSKVIVPSLLAINQQSPRYLRGLNWDVGTTGLDTPINFTAPSNRFNYNSNQRKYEVVKGSDYGLTKKDYNDPGMYRMQADWKATEQRHRHECFFNSVGDNKNVTTGNNFGSVHPNAFNVLNPGNLRSDLLKYSFTKNKTVAGKRVPNDWANMTPVPMAGVFAWKATTANQASSTDSTSNFVIQNSEETLISSDAAARFKQLELINYAEGAAPIANRGGSSTLLTEATHIHCKKKRKLKRATRVFGHTSEYHDCVAGQSGGYNIQKATESDDAEADVPRCVTSLPHEDINKEKSVYEEPYKMKVGNQTITPDMSLSFPPTTVLLPLFKI